MNKVVVLLSFLTVLTAGGLGYALQGQRKAQEKLSTDLQVAQSHLSVKQAALKARETAGAEQEAKIKELTAALTAAKAEARVYRDKVKEYDQQSDRERLARLKKESDMRQAMSEVPAPLVTLTTNEAGRELKQTVFPKLQSRAGLTLATNAEFLNVDGSRLFFKYATGGGAAYDVDALHLGVLAHLGIDPEAAKQLQAKLEAQRAQEENLRLQAAAARIAFYEKLRNDRMQAEAKIAAQKAAELKSQAEADQIKRQADNERLQAEAAKKQADAAYLNALRPDYNNNPNPQRNPR